MSTWVIDQLDVGGSAISPGRLSERKSLGRSLRIFRECGIFPAVQNHVDERGRVKRQNATQVTRTDTQASYSNPNKQIMRNFNFSACETSPTSEVYLLAKRIF